MKTLSIILLTLVSFGLTQAHAGISIETAGIGIQEGDLSLYPNPVQDLVEVQYTFEKNDKIQVINIVGKTVVTERVDTDTNIHRMKLKSLPEGMYFIHVIRDGAVVQSKRLMKN
jgi:hypothetical protein